MKAIRFANKTVSLVQLPRPVPGPDEAVVKVIMSGICQTDIELLEGYYDFQGIPGHEFVGLVVEAPNHPELMDKRVVSDINIGCGRCQACASGDTRHCDDRKVIGIKHRDGAFADFVRAPVSNLHLVDSSIPDDQAVFAEPLAAALQISQQVHITAPECIAVLGDGKLGLLASLALHPFNPSLCLIGRHAEKLNVAERAGIRVIRVSPSESPLNLENRLGRFDLVVEATGSPDGIHHALALVRPKGTVIVKTTSHTPSEINLADVVVREIRLIGSRCGDLSLALEFLKNRWIAIKPLIESVYSFTDFQEALSHASRAGAGKILIRHAIDITG